MNAIKKQSFLIIVAIFVFALSVTIPTVTFAASGVTVKFPVTVIKPGDDALKPQPYTYVNMYEIKLINDEYVGKLVNTLSTGKKGKSAIFNVKPGKVVHFIGFSDKALALETKKYSQFTTPPFKNFSNVDGIKGQLCLTDGVDFDKKLGTAENNESTLSIACTKKGAFTELTNGNIVKYPVVVVDENDDNQKPIPYTYINMYEITLVDDTYAGKLVSTLPTGKSGKQAIFKVKPGQVVHFLGFKTKTQAKKVTAYSDFSTPPYKNFSIYDGIFDRLCYTDGIDFDNKLGESDSNVETLSMSCSKGPAAVFLTNTNNIEPPKTKVSVDSKKDYSNDTTAPVITSIEGQAYFVSKFNYNYGIKVKVTATDDSGQIALIKIDNYNSKDTAGWKKECGPMASPATCNITWGGFDFDATYEYYAEVYDMAGNKTTSEMKYFKTPVE